MKIIDKITGESVPFSFLSDGQVFKGEFSGVYLKIASFPVCKFDDSDDDRRYNAFDLEGRYLVFFSGDTKVLPVETTLIITSFKET